MYAFLRIIKFSLQDIARNIGLSFMTVFILILMLLAVNVLWSVDIVTKEAVKTVKNEVNMSLYFKTDATPKQTEEVKAFLTSLPEVVSVSAVSKEQVLEDFKARHQGKDDVLSALDELDANPFGPTLIVKAHEPEQYKTIMTAIDVPQYQEVIEAKSFDEHEDAITGLQAITNRIERLGFGLTVLFAVISFLIIFNTIRVAIFTQRREISIKRLVGASNWFIRGPYVVESFIFTFVSVGLTIAIVFLALRWIDPYITVVFPSGFSLTNYYTSHILTLLGVQLPAVLLLNVVSSSLAMRKQLQV